MKSLLVLAVLCCFSAAYGLTCYQCDSQDSFEACDKTRVNATCSAGHDRCVKSDITGKLSGKEVKSFSKDCATKAHCDVKDSVCKVMAASRGLTDAKCDVHCCEGDLCNGGKVPLVSFIVLSACALVACIR